MASHTRSRGTVAQHQPASAAPHQFILQILLNVPCTTLSVDPPKAGKSRHMRAFDGKAHSTVWVPATFRPSGTSTVGITPGSHTSYTWAMRLQCSCTVWWARAFRQPQTFLPQTVYTKPRQAIRAAAGPRWLPSGSRAAVTVWPSLQPQ